MTPAATSLAAMNRTVTGTVAFVLLAVGGCGCLPAK
jgi:hypothetical protein